MTHIEAIRNAVKTAAEMNMHILGLTLEEVPSRFKDDAMHNIKMEYARHQIVVCPEREYFVIEWTE